MAIRYYQDYWRYTDPYGTVYNLAAFQDYLDKVYPKKYQGDYSTQAAAERELIEKGGWKKEQNPPEVPTLEEVVGKILQVSQHAEPREYVRSAAGDHWHVFNFKDLDTEWWRLARPDILDDNQTSWGRSNWLIGHDGTLTFSGANYDSSD